MKRDLQKNAVYAWERQNVMPFDRNVVPFEQIESIVKYVWASEKLSFPPLVEKLPSQARKGGDGCRTKVRFQGATYTFIILHELAHALTGICTGETNKHGALFMGMYCQLLNRYLNLDFDKLVQSAKEAGLKVKPDAKPVFLD